MKKIFTKRFANFLKSALVLSLMLGGYSQSVKAQTASLYTFAASSSTFSYLSGGTTISTISSDDATSSAINIGFTFNYCGTGYTQLKACSNGWLTFNTSVTSTQYSNSLTNYDPLKPALMPWFDDMEGYFGTASYATTGTTGSRVFTIEYKNWDIDWSYDANFTFQVKLFEATGVIQYIYNQETAGYYGGYEFGTIGIGDGASTPTYLTLNGTGTSPSASSTTFTTSLNGRPANGQIYQFTPPPACTGTPTAGTATISSSTICLGSTITLNVPSASIGFGITYQWQQSATGTGGWTNVTGATTATSIVTPTAATYYRCFVNCTPSGLGDYSSTVSVAFTYNILSKTDSFRCGTGTAVLQATGTSGATLKWYAAASGGTALGSGSPFTTPIISGTTNYYVGAEVSASGTGTIGTGSTTSSSTGSSPFSQSWESNHSQYLILASELAAKGLAAGNITALSIPVSTKNSSLSFSGYSIKMGHTSSTALTAGTFLAPTFTTVYGASTYTSTLGANVFTFTTSFNWDGTSNVVIDICFDNDPTSSGVLYSSNDVVTATTKSYLAAIGIYADNSTYCGATSGTYSASTSNLPDFTFTGNKVCSSPRVTVTATVNTAPTFGITGTQTLCNNGVGTLSVTSTLSNYNTYKWSPATGLFTDAACTTPYITGASASTVYAKTTTAGTIKYFCTANNTTSLCSNLDSVSVTTLPSAITAVATPSSICGSGNTTLTITPSVSGFGAAQYQWQTSPNNGTWTDSSGRTTSSLTTNTISATRYYRVILKNSAGTTCINSTSDTGLVYNPKIDSVKNAARCSFGTVVLNAYGSDGSVEWYAASSGGSSLSTGNTYTTPSIGSTTTYYAQVRSTPDANYVTGTGTTTIGTSTGGNGLTPFSQYYESALTQYLILASDLTAAGLTAGSFSSMSFDVSTKNSSAAYIGYTISLAHTSATSLSSGFISPTFTTVYGPSSYTTTSGTNAFPMTGGFSWNGTSNIVVRVCFSNATGSYSGYTNNDAVNGTSKSYTCTYGWYEDNAYLCTGVGSYYSTASGTVLPNITFTKKGCVSARTAVVATVNPLPTPTISPATGPIQICDGSTTTFTGGGGGNYQWRNATGLISGATSSTYTTGTTGSYRVIVTNPITGCKDSSVVVGVNVNPVPTVSISPAGTTKICEDSSQLFTSVVTGSGLSYKWYNSGVLMSGETTDSLRRNTSGVYTLRVFLGSCSDTSNEATFIVNPLPAASFTKTGTTGAICLGGTLELTALTIPTGSSYQWALNGVDISGATSKIFNASMGGIYTVRIKDANNCRKTSDTISIINTPMGIPNLSPLNARFCEGTELKLYSNAGPFASKFVWTRNGTTLPDTTATIVSAINGIYDVFVTDVYGCSLLSPKATLTIDALPIKPVITRTGYTLSIPSGYSSYQWYRNGKTITGATSRFYTLMFDGSYHVVVTNAANCFNISDTMEVQALSVKQITRENLDIKVYPNPSQNVVMIDAPIAVNLMVKDMQGRQILKVENAKQVDMSVYADGVYFFTLTDKEGIVVKMDKVVKRTN